MISITLLSTLVYVALAATVLIPLLMGVMLLSDWKGGKLW